MADLPGAFRASAQSKAIADIADYALAAPDRRLARQTARTRAKAGELQLEQQQFQFAQQKQNAPGEQQQIQEAMKLQQMQNQKLFGDLAKQSAYSSFSRYQADGNARHLNTMLAEMKQNPAGAKLMPEVVRIDKFEAPTGDDDKMLQRAGILNTSEFYANKEMKDRFVKVTLANGAQEVRDMNQMYIGTGYTNYMKDADVERMLKQSQIVKNLQTKAAGAGPQGAQIEREAQTLIDEATARGESLAMTDALQLARKRAGAFGTKDERQTQRDPDERSDVVTASDEFKTPEAERKQRLVDTAKSELDTAFGGDFENADLTNLDKDQRVTLDRNLRRIEKVGGLEFSESDKKQLTDIAQLTAVGDPASSITSSETGIIDRAFNSVKKYASDETPGVDATSAYAAFRNSVRNALFGSALTAAEITSFDQAFGTLGQQAGPVLQQFITALTQVQGKLESIANLNDPYVVKARLGKSQAQLEDMILAIKERVDQFNRIEPNVRVQATPPAAKPPISSFFNQ